MAREARGTEREAVGASSAAERIVAAAQRLFPRRGFRGTSMEDIAEEAGLAKATLYLHFDGKDAIYRALFDRCRAEIAVRGDAAERAEEPLAERLTALIYAYNGTALEFFGDVHYLREAHNIILADPDRFGSGEEELLEQRLVSMLKQAADRNEAVALTRTERAAVARVLTDVARGAKVEGISPAHYRQRLKSAADLIIAGLVRRPTD